MNHPVQARIPQVRPYRGPGTRGGLLATFAVCLLLVTTLTGCSTDDNAGGLTPSCLTLIPERTPPIDGEVALVWGSESTCNTLELEVVISGVDHVWGVSFELVYPVGISQYAAADVADSFLRGGNGTDDLIVEAQEIVPGRVEVGVTRVDSQNNAGVAPTVDNTLLVRLFFFRIVSDGSGDVTLEDFELTQVENPGEIPTPFDPPVPVSGGEFFIEN